MNFKAGDIYTLNDDRELKATEMWLILQINESDYYDVYIGPRFAEEDKFMIGINTNIGFLKICKKI